MLSEVLDILDQLGILMVIQYTAVVVMAILLYHRFVDKG